MTQLSPDNNSRSPVPAYWPILPARTAGAKPEFTHPKGPEGPRDRGEGWGGGGLRALLGSAGARRLGGLAWWPLPSPAKGALRAQRALWTRPGPRVPPGAGRDGIGPGPGPANSPSRQGGAGEKRRRPGSQGLGAGVHTAPEGNRRRGQGCASRGVSPSPGGQPGASSTTEEEGRPQGCPGRVSGPRPLHLPRTPRRPRRSS
jgi:hypothetical protein